LQTYISIAKKDAKEEQPEKPPISLGYSTIVKGGNHLYFVPYGGQGDVNHGLHLRYDLTKEFTDGLSWEMFDGHLSFADDKRSRLFNFTGYLGAAVHDNYIYYAPLEAAGKNTHGMAILTHFRALLIANLVLRYDMRLPFTDSASWEYNTLSRVNNLDSRGYSDVVAIGKYLYFVPLTRGPRFEDFHGTPRQNLLA